MSNGMEYNGSSTPTWHIKTAFDPKCEYNINETYRMNSNYIHVMNKNDYNIEFFDDNGKSVSIYNLLHFTVEGTKQFATALTVYFKSNTIIKSETIKQMSSCKITISYISSNMTEEIKVDINDIEHILNSSKEYDDFEYKLIIRTNDKIE